MRPRAVVLAAALTLAACGGGSSADKTAQPHPKRDTRKPPATQTSPAPAPPGSRAAVRTIRDWAVELRRGHVRKAAAYFALPAVVSNSGPAIRLTTRAEVQFFNLSLPCGARLVRTIAGRRYTIATFELVERRGSPAGCDGVGALAATAFAFRHGKISEWRRVTVPPSAPET